MLFVLFAYVALQLAIGVWASRKVHNEDDYLVAGRSIGPALAAGSIFATWFGAESCVGAAGNVYTNGLSLGTTEPFAYGACLLLMGLLFAARFWKRKITTLADLFRDRYGGSTERIAAVLLLPASILWAGAQVRAFGHVVAVNSDGMIPEGTAVAIAAIVAIVYTGVGGLLADVYTDIVQGVALVIGLIALVIATVVHFGGVDGTIENLEAARAAAAAREPLSWLEIAEMWAVPIFGSIVSQEAVSRSLAARSAKVARNAAIVGGSCYILFGLLPVFLGLIGPKLLPDLADPETLLPSLAQQHLPTVINVLFAGALISAILSTVDSCLLVAASVTSRNLVLGGNRQASERTRLWLARYGVVTGGLIAWFLARTSWNVKQLVEDASGFGSAGIFVIVTMAVYSKRGGAWAANLSLLSGLVTWVLGRYILQEVLDGTADTALARHPYLWSLGAAIFGYALGCLLEPKQRHRPAPA